MTINLSTYMRGSAISPIAVTNGGTGTTTSTGTGNVVLSNGPTLVSPIISNPSNYAVNFGSGALTIGNIDSSGNLKFTSTNLGVYSIATNGVTYLVADSSAYSGVYAYGTTHATKASQLEIKASNSIIGTFSSTGLSVNGALSATGAPATANNSLLAITGTTTARAGATIINDGGSALWMVESSTGGTSISGSSAYSTNIGTRNSTPLHLVISGAVSATLDTSGNLGLGVTPELWYSQFRTLRIGNKSALCYYSDGTFLSNNYYVNSGGVETYIDNGYLTTYAQNSSGQHLWYSAPSNTHGAGYPASPTAKMTLDTTGRLGVGMTPSANTGRLAISSSSDATKRAAITINSPNYFKMLGKMIGNYNSTITDHALFTLLGSTNVGYVMKFTITTTSATLNMYNIAQGYAFSRWLGGVYQNTSIAQPTTVNHLNMASCPYTINFVGNGNDLLITVNCSAPNNYIMTSFDVEITCRDDGGVIWYPEVYSVG